MASLEQTYRDKWYQYYNQRRNAGTEGQSGSRTSLEKQHRHPNSLETRRWAMARERQLYSSGSVGLSQSTKSYDAFMQFWVNPSECSWQVGLRSAFQKTSGGAVHFEIQKRERNPNEQISRFDLPILNISFQSGIIMPGGYNHIENGNLPNVIPHGLANFYDFLDLLDQPNLTADGQPNYVNIMYVSPMHGNRGIWLRGFFDENGVSFSDSADNPNTISNWTAAFWVCISNPPLSQLRASYQPNNKFQSTPGKPPIPPEGTMGTLPMSMPGEIIT